MEYIIRIFKSQDNSNTGLIAEHPVTDAEMSVNQVFNEFGLPLSSDWEIVEVDIMEAIVSLAAKARIFGDATSFINGHPVRCELSPSGTGYKSWFVNNESVSRRNLVAAIGV